MKLPEDYIESMRQLLGEEELQNYLDCFDAPRTYGLRVNTGKISVETFLKRTPFHLTPVPWVENGFYYDPEEGVTKHPDYYAGLYYIQEPSAMVPASRLPIEEGDRVLDLCAAPGAKIHGAGCKASGDGASGVKRYQPFQSAGPFEEPGAFWSRKYSRHERDAGEPSWELRGLFR